MKIRDRRPMWDTHIATYIRDSPEYGFACPESPLWVFRGSLEDGVRNNTWLVRRKVRVPSPTQIRFGQQSVPTHLKSQSPSPLVWGSLVGSGFAPPSAPRPRAIPSVAEAAVELCLKALRPVDSFLSHMEKDSRVSATPLAHGGT